MGTSCEPNSSYSFVPINLKLYICFLHGMRMCMWFGYNYKIIFCHFFHIVNLVIFHPFYINSWYLLWVQLLLQFCTDYYETLHCVFFMVWGCACDLDVIVKLFFFIFSMLWKSFFTLNIQTPALVAQLDARPTGDQEVAGSTPTEVGNILSWRLIMKYFLRSFSPFRWFKKGSCQFLAKECAQYWLTA